MNRFENRKNFPFVLETLTEVQKNQSDTFGKKHALSENPSLPQDVEVSPFRFSLTHAGFFSINF
jgi:hypothetical protein